MSEYRYTKTSKKPLIFLIVALVLVVAAIVVVLIFMNSSKNPPKNDVTSQTVATYETLEQTDAPSTAQSSVEQQPATDSQQSSEQSSESEKVVVPTINGEAQGEFFSASFTPYKAVDTLTDSEAGLKEVFGSSYSGGSILFNSDGTFSDTLSLTSANSGAYSVEGDLIVATYTNDKNIMIKVTNWNDKTPAEIIINYGGYDVYFN